MVDGFGTTPEEMAQAAAHVQNVSQSVNGDLAALRGKLEPLAGAVWKGQASVAFAGLMRRWDTDAKQLNDALAAIGGALKSSGQGYSDDQESTTSALASVDTGTSTITQALG